MTIRFSGYPPGDRDKSITVVWTDGVFTAPDADSEPFAKRCVELAHELQNEWAIAPGLPAEPPGDHSKTSTGAWFLVGKVMRPSFATGDEKPQPRTGPHTFVV